MLLLGAMCTALTPLPPPPVHVQCYTNISAAYNTRFSHSYILAQSHTKLNQMHALSQRTTTYKKCRARAATKHINVYLRARFKKHQKYSNRKSLEAILQLTAHGSNGTEGYFQIIDSLYICVLFISKCASSHILVPGICYYIHFNIHMFASNLSIQCIVPVHTVYVYTVTHTTTTTSP